MNFEQLYSLAKEYREQAHRHSRDVQTETQLRQYYTLIKLAIQTLRHIKTTLNLSINQDYQITMDLVDILLRDTLNFELAETYLSALRQRLQNYSGVLSTGRLSDEYLNMWLQIEFTALYTVSLKRNSRFHYKVALQNCEDLLRYLGELHTQSQRVNADTNTDTDTGSTSHELLGFWYQIFKYVAAHLCMKLGRVKRAKGFLEEMLQQGTVPTNTSWLTFIELTLVNLLLENRHIDAPFAMIEKYLETTADQTLDENLFVWKLVTRLLYKIRNDRNITHELNEFKVFFDTHKQQQQKEREEEEENVQSTSIQISFTETLKLRFYHPSLFNHRDLKYLLLFLQSISYMVNCYDKLANFSTRFLPKVIRYLEGNLEQVSTSSLPEPNTGVVYTVTELDDKLVWYDAVLRYAKFYQVWEHLLLKSSLKELGSLSVTELPHSNYLQVMQQHVADGPEHFDAQSQLAGYEKFCHRIKQTNQQQQQQQHHTHSHGVGSNLDPGYACNTEFELLELLNQYTVQVALISEQTDGDKQEYLETAKAVWSRIEAIATRYNYTQNLTWDCTLTVLWIVSHMEPFTSSPLPSSETERSLYIEKLRAYYRDNKLISSPEDDHECSDGASFKVKKSLFLLIMVNYLGGRLIETDINKMFELSSKCFHVAKKQHVDVITYVIGLWHLANCTIMMNAKDVTITNAKLQSLVNRLYEGKGEDITHLPTKVIAP